MILLINTSKLRFGGAVQVALSFIHECRSDERHEYHVVVGPGVGAVLNSVDFPKNFHFYKKSFGVIGLSKLHRVQREMSEIEEEVRPDCIVTTSGPPFWRSRAPHLVGFNRPLFIYPESPYIQNLSATRKARLTAQCWLHRRYFRRDADALIVQTDDVNERVRRLLGTDNVYTVTNTHNAWYDQPKKFPRKLPDRQPDLYRFLTPTSYYPHKNLELIPEILNSLSLPLRSRVEFVLTITEEEFLDRIGSEIPSGLRLIGPVPPPECPALYQECDAMFLPTLAECFSASYPEAMRMGLPICGDAALYFKPCDPESAAQQVVQLVEDTTLQEKLRKLGNVRLPAFDTPAERARKILDICESLAIQNNGLSVGPTVAE